MKLLMLYGVNCTKKVWSYLAPYISDYEIDYVEYPHDITLKANSINDLTKWVYENFSSKSYDAIIGHSLGGLIAMQLVAQYNMKFDKIVYLDTNLRPANEFYRNLMTHEHMEIYKEEIVPMLQEERKYYTQQLFSSIQGEFDYTNLLDHINQKVYAIYGDRNMPDYPNKITDLNVSKKTLEKLDLRFINNSCHMIMVENPKKLSEIIREIIKIK